MSYQGTVDNISAIVQTWHGTEGLSLEEVVRLRHDLSGHYFFLAVHVKPLFKARGLTYLQRKRNMAAAMNELIASRSGLSKAEAEKQTEALAKTYQDKLAEIDAESEVDALRTLIGAIRYVLDAMQQEIANLRYERERSNYLEGLDIPPPYIEPIEAGHDEVPEPENNRP
jgi:hypothetical protein